jgi:hypothetical protein
MRCPSLLWNDGGSPPGVPGGGITGMTPAPVGGTAMLGSTSAGGQITPLERDNSSLKLALPVVSPGEGRTKPPVRKHPVTTAGGGRHMAGLSERSVQFYEDQRVSRGARV